jgi:hypothetical protein
MLDKMFVAHNELQNNIFFTSLPENGVKTCFILMRIQFVLAFYIS